MASLSKSIGRRVTEGVSDCALETTQNAKVSILFQPINSVF